jgi:hypothetical protein
MGTRISVSAAGDGPVSRHRLIYAWGMSEQGSAVCQRQMQYSETHNGLTGTSILQLGGEPALAGIEGSEFD